MARSKNIESILLNKAIGERLKVSRTNKNFSVREVAQLTKIHRTQIVQFEKGAGGGVRLIEAIKLSKIYDISLYEISGLQGPEEDNDLQAIVNAAKAFTPELRFHYRFVLRAIQNRLEEEEIAKGRSVDFGKKASSA